MARSARKPERETDEPAKQALTKPDKTIAMQTAAQGRDAAAQAASSPSSKPDIDFAGLQSGQFETLRAVLEKRSNTSASENTIAKRICRPVAPGSCGGSRASGSGLEGSRGA